MAPNYHPKTLLRTWTASCHAQFALVEHPLNVIDVCVFILDFVLLSGFEQLSGRRISEITFIS